jgi:hypothetical protein
MRFDTAGYLRWASDIDWSKIFNSTGKVSERHQSNRKLALNSRTGGGVKKKSGTEGGLTLGE